jgi:hypothetical protein
MRFSAGKIERAGLINEILFVANRHTFSLGTGGADESPNYIHKQVDSPLPQPDPRF